MRALIAGLLLADAEGDDPRYAQADFDDRGWKARRAPIDAAARDVAREKLFWLRRYLDLPADAMASAGRQRPVRHGSSPTGPRPEL